MSLDIQIFVLNVDLWTLIIADNLRIIVVVLDLIAAQVAVEELVLVAHAVVPVEPFKVALLPPHPHERVVPVAVLVVAVVVAREAAGEALADAAALDVVGAAGGGIVVLTVGDALLDEVAEFLQEVQFKAGLLRFVVPGAHVLGACQVVLRLGVLLHTHNRPAARELGPSAGRDVLDLEAELAAGRGLLGYAFSTALRLRVVRLLLKVLVPRRLLDLAHWVEVQDVVRARREVHVPDATFDVLLFVAEDLVGGDLAPELNHLVFLSN